MTALFIDTNGKIRVNEFPERRLTKDVVRQFNLYGLNAEEREELYKRRQEIIDEQYEAAVQAALDNGVECEDQRYAGMLLSCTAELETKDITPMEPHEIHGYKMEVKEVEIPCPDGIEGCEVLHLKKLATLIPEK